MQSSTPIIDLHVHSTLKPFGNSFYSNSNSKLYTNPACIWFSDKFGGFDSFFENTLGISRYRQSDFTTLIEGQYQIVCVSQYPIEKEFFDIRNEFLSRFENHIAQFASLLGKERIKYVRSNHYNYFEDLCNEYEYLKLLNGKTPTGSSKFYTILPNGSNLTQNSNLSVIITIEGCHSFCNGTDTRNLNNWKSLSENVAHVKNWEHPPFFVTFAHHFYNGLCTHAKSLYDASGKLLNQEYGMRNKGFSHQDNEPPISAIGIQLIKLLLNNKNEPRILIDVKHMSLEARQEYYAILKTNYKDEKIPIIWSHGAVDKDNNQEININLTIDVLPIYESNGIIGIEIDQRILGYNSNRFSKWFRSIYNSKNKKAYNDASYVWDQIITIAEFAYKNNYTDKPWQCIALGTDYDGVINPLNNYRDASTMSLLYNNLVLYLTEYWKKSNPTIPKKADINAQDVIYAVMYKNAYHFIQNNYKEGILII